MKSQKCGMAESQALSKAFNQALSPYRPAVGNGTDKERETYWRESGRKMLASALNLGVSQCYNWDEMMQMLMEAIDKAPCMRWMDPIHLAVSQVAAFRGAPHAGAEVILFCCDAVADPYVGRITRQAEEFRTMGPSTSLAETAEKFENLA